MNPDAWWLVVTLTMTVIGPTKNPAIGPMSLEQCRAVAAAIDAEELEAVVETDCKRPRVITVCPMPGNPGAGGVCPVWDYPGPFTGAPDQK